MRLTNQSLMQEHRQISIHAPIVGCDHDGEWFDRCCMYISIHAPIVGCDKKKKENHSHHRISIHAPIVGCDKSCLSPH